MAEAIVKDKKRILPCAAYLQGEFGHNGIFLGVPCKLGVSGIQEIVEVDLTESERNELAKSAEAVRSSMKFLSN